MPRRQETVMVEEEAGEMVELTSKDSEIMNIPGVGSATAEKLIAAGYDNMLSVAVTSPKEFMELAGVTEAAARKMIQYAREKLDLGFESGEDVLKKRESIEKIHSGSQALDTLLGGGFETRAITEAYGMYGSGKCVSKDTKVLYFNSSKSHLQPMEDIYSKYAAINGERPFDDGFIVDVPQVEVLGLADGGIKRTKATTLYKEKVPKLVSIRTKRGRTVKITPSHKLLSFNNGLSWQPAATLQAGAVIAYPKEMNANSDCGLTADDAYFLGLFAAEGTANPLSISTSSKELREWVSAYVKNRFDYEPTIMEDNRRETPVYTILLRKATSGFLGELANSNSASKSVPEGLFGADEKVTVSFLSGYMDGDGHYGTGMAEATTKSKRLSADLSYMFAKIGVAVTIREKIIKGVPYYRLSVVGEDRNNLGKVVSKIKSFKYNSRNSSYGYPTPLTDYLKAVYRATLGGARGKTGKAIGSKHGYEAFFYSYLVGKKAPAAAMNEKTLESIRATFFEGLKSVISLKEHIGNLETLSQDEFTRVINSLPFAFNSVAGRIGVKKSSIRNYMTRGVAPERVDALKQALLDELETRSVKLEAALLAIKNFSYLNWDTISEIKEIDYNDYVYDFVVPEGHSFIGGEMPTIMHNTQIGHVIATHCLKQNPDAYVVYIDTESTFRPERVVSIAKGLDMDPADALKRIKVARAFNSDHQVILAEKVDELIKQGLNIKLVIVDSLTAHFRAEFIGRGTLADRQQKINKHLHTLMKLAEMHNLAIYVTNQVMSKPDTFFGDPTEAIGGHIVAHASTYRIYLRRGKKGTRVAKLVDSPNLPESEAIFVVEESGIHDA